MLDSALDSKSYGKLPTNFSITKNLSTYSDVKIHSNAA